MLRTIHRTMCEEKPGVLLPIAHFGPFPGSFRSKSAELASLPSSSLAPEHVLDPAILAHPQPCQGARCLEHGVARKPLLHAHHHRGGAEHLATAHTAERLVLVEGTGTAPGFAVEEVARTAGDAGLGACPLAQAALHAVHLDEREAGLVASRLQGPMRDIPTRTPCTACTRHRRRRPFRTARQAEDRRPPAAAVRARRGGRAPAVCRCVSRRTLRTSPVGR